MTETFNPDLTIQSIKQSLISPTDIALDQVVIILEQFLIFMKQVSNLISLAFADIKEKKEIFQQHIITYNTNELYKIVEKERELKLMELNGDNNKKFTKDEKYLKYVSAARTMKVIMRFFNFLIFTFEEIQNPQNSFAFAVKEAYRKSLADFHPWLLRQTASAAFNAVPKREFVLSVLGDNPIEKCAMLQSELTKLNRTLDQYYQDNKLTELP